MKTNDGNNEAHSGHGNPKPRPGWENENNQDNTGANHYTPRESTARGLMLEYLISEMFTEAKDELIKEFKQVAMFSFREVHKHWVKTLTTVENSSIEPVLISPKDAAKMLGVTTRTLEN